MPDKTIVLVSELDDSTHGEIHVLAGAQEAAHLVETLLEAGFGRERLRVFAVDELELQITHRPVVALVGAGPPAPAPEAPSDTTEEEEEEEESQPHRKEPAAPRAKDVAIATAPYMRNGVRFSTLFRQA
ncbi:MAG: hypothetical protein Q7T33_06890 [Dehalococcoidia bacterium]|nr:hypothetical protein [Dehalococcoidia bacterium]